MSTLGITTRHLPVIDRAAVRLGTSLAAWGRAHAARRLDRSDLERYRAGYDERVRDAAARDHAGLLP